MEIDRPAADVFPYLAASERRSEWMEKLVESRQLEDGPPRLGTRFEDVFEGVGQRVELDAEIVEWEPNERLGLLLRAGGFEATVSQRLQERDGRTRLTTVIDTEYTNLAARLMSRVVARQAAKQLEIDLGRLKALLETARAG